jgi:hypothetical protein
MHVLVFGGPIISADAQEPEISDQVWQKFGDWGQQL